MSHQYDEYVDFANFLADESEMIIEKYFRKKFNINNKEDSSPVTIADQNTELKIRELITSKYPSHGILGEEFENKNTESEFIWVIDPIDGTRSFICGHKDFGTLISLLHNNEPILGIVNCPAHKERWIGVKNQLTKCNGMEVKTSNKERLEDSYLLTTGLYFEEPILKKGIEPILKKVKYYKFGGDCYMYGMLASGMIEIVIEDTLKAHDYMALINVVEGAGGKITDKYGKSINLFSDGSLVASCNKKVHDQLISLINI